MTYQALYRKYRPAVFEDMAGQKQIVQTLQNAIAADRISHAYLFCGPRGTGKTSAAKIFARALNCTSDQTRPCGHCENCLAADHPDIIEIDAASNNGVEEARNLVERVKYTPMLGKYKVYIIDEVHMMTAGAFNALLKTIEEPLHMLYLSWQPLNRIKSCPPFFQDVRDLISRKSQMTRLKNGCCLLPSGRIHYWIRKQQHR